MQSKEIVFTEALNAELQDTDFNEGALGPGELIIRTKCSLVSAGTELAIYKGTESWATLPTAPGYAAQLFALSGANVIGVDISDGRIECARRCGLEHTINPSKVDLKQTVMDLTGGGGYRSRFRSGSRSGLNCGSRPRPLASQSRWLAR